MRIHIYWVLMCLKGGIRIRRNSPTLPPCAFANAVVFLTELRLESPSRGEQLGETDTHSAVLSGEQ